MLLLPLLCLVTPFRSQHEGLQNQLSSMRAELRVALRAVNDVRQAGLPPLSQAAQALAAGISAGLSGLSAVELEMDRLAYMLRSSEQQVCTWFVMGFVLDAVSCARLRKE
jgi:hypothetical protein